MSGEKQNIKTTITLDLDTLYLEEIISILAQHGRPDLIGVLRQNRDDDYKPPKKKIKEYYEYYEGDGEEESYSSSDVLVDKDGFLSLK